MSEMSNYADRIQAATNTLEANVGDVEAFVPQLSQAVDNAQQAAQEVQNTVDGFNDQHPLLKAEYGAVSVHTSRVVIASAEALDDAYGNIYKMDSGASGVSIDALPEPSFSSVHFYVYNTSGASVSITSSEGTVADGSVPDESMALIVANETQDGYYTIPLAGTSSGGGGEEGSFDWTSIPEATTSLKGLMSAEDKTKLDGVSSSVATTTENGLMSSSDKDKLDNVDEQAQKNVKADFDAESGDAQILNKPGVVFKGPTIYNPLTGYEYSGPGTDGYMPWQDARNFETLWDDYQDGTVGFAGQSPDDSATYVRREQQWSKLQLANYVEREYPFDDIMYIPGMMSGQDKEAFDTIKDEYDNGTLSGISDAPSDGSQYARKDGSWEVVEGGGGSSGISDAPSDGSQYVRKDGAWEELTAPPAASSVSFLDIIKRGQSPSTVWEEVLVDSQALWEKLKTPAGLLEIVYGVRDVRDVPFELGAVPIHLKASYSGRDTETPEAAPFAVGNSNWILVEARPLVGLYEDNPVVNADGGGLYVEVTHITASSTDVRQNDPTQFGAFSRRWNIRKYINHTYSLKIGEQSPVVEDVQWPFLWQVVEYTDATGFPSAI